MKLRAFGRIGKVGAPGEDRIGRLSKEERRLTVWLVAHFPRMVGIVAADAKDPPDRENATPMNWDAGDGEWRNDKITHVDVSEQVGRSRPLLATIAPRGRLKRLGRRESDLRSSPVKL